MSKSAKSSSLPLPRLVLRVGFAGRRQLSEKQSELVEKRLGELFDFIGRRLESVLPERGAKGGYSSLVTRYYSDEPPLVRLVVGLCEGADTLAVQALERVTAARAATFKAERLKRAEEQARRQAQGDATADSEQTESDVLAYKTEVAAVIPFDVATYRATRYEWFRAEFDRQLESCAWVLALDGLYDKPTHDPPWAKRRRNRAYRAQSAFLVRQSDLLVAVADPDEPGKAGGTLESVRLALEFGLPVVFVHSGNGSMYLLEPEDDWQIELSKAQPAEWEWQSRLRSWVLQLTADPDQDPALAEANGHDQRGPQDGGEVGGHGASAGEVRHYVDSLLSEYFAGASRTGGKRVRRLDSWRASVWSRFERFFRSGPASATDSPVPPYSEHRKRASTLSGYFSGLYRGAFLLNYGLAVVAVSLAAVSLTVLAIAGHPSHGVLWTLLGLGAAKCGIVAFIVLNTRRANREHWSDRAVDYRYLAERLRCMFYLPLVGSHQPPAAGVIQFSSRTLRQGAADWLFDALVRSISPAELAIARERQIPSHDGARNVKIRKLIEIDTLEVVRRVRDEWIDEQAKYHERSSRTMHAINHAAEWLSRVFGLAVLGIVAVDILVAVAELCEGVPPFLKHLVHWATPMMICLTAILPAVVAALGGLRFQSECSRLAERSGVMVARLRRRARTPDAPRGRWEAADDLAKTLTRVADEARRDPHADPGSWNYDALRLTELVAADFIQETAEWSVLYAKEVSEPG